ncbi:MAG: Methyltransferase FkbM family [Candidatus Woesebacteria bacterium GW2011_GWB1_38_8]|uniref:Methyltransferase FkbM family n=1 Tax=Candidatus Woesebacteria bacterium GW2011_GWB1_38_8 TaxID=1618570 RepID=A0A0G0NJV2_9BACT|nr:MAG: Methyltransferase FkbM family [Candidatus Woesebacteria bacterium GW2011_GWB1_38_8]
MKLAPIVLFTYNRPRHLRRTIKSLQNNTLAEKSELFVFSDGPKDKNAEEDVVNVRNYLKTVKGFNKVVIVPRKFNCGLAKNITNGVNRIVNQYGRVIVVEDDLICAKGFLKYMNDSLELYKNNFRVMHISGYVVPVKVILPSIFFYRQASCWGWATWKRAWKYYTSDTKYLLKYILQKNLSSEFNLNNSYDFLGQLKANLKGDLNTWAIKWYASVFINGGLCLHPGKSLVQNIGTDSSGTHFGLTKDYEHMHLANYVKVEDIPVIESLYAVQSIANFFKEISRQKMNLGIRDRIIKFLKLVNE